MLVPVSEHPLFPGSSQAVALTEDQFGILKSSDHQVFASVVSNDGVFKKNLDLMQQLDPAHQHQTSFNLPQITDLSDVYDIGVICDTKVVKDEKNLFMPYVLNIFPKEKAQLIQAVNSDQQVGPLTRVIIQKLREEIVEEDDLDTKQSVTFKFLQQQFLKCFKIAPDERFIQYLTALERSYDIKKIQSFIHMILTCVSMPQYVNTYKFLINTDKHQLQQVFQEPDLRKRLELTNDLFSNFTNKLELWDKLEQQYDFKQDQHKTQKKLEEIYESLKKHFSKDSDEK